MAKRTKSYGLNNPLQDVFPVPVRAQRAPTGNDTRYEVGQLWIDIPNEAAYILTNVASGSASWGLASIGAGDLETLTGDTGGVITPTSGNINIVGSDLTTVDGAGSTLTITETSGAYPITSFVVGVSGEAGYTTVQSAINAAVAVGGGTVYIKRGTFTENLTLFDNIDLVGAVGSSDSGDPTINGTHTPPAGGAFAISKINLQSSTDIFNSAVAGTTNITLTDVSINVTNGFTFNLVNWTGTLSASNIVEVQSTNDGWVNNSTGGASIFMTNSSLGAGSVNTMSPSGTVELYNCKVDCPVNFQTGSVATISGGCIFNELLTFSGDSSCTIVNSAFRVSSGAAIIHSSTSPISISSSVIDTPGDPAISGAGAGGLSLTGIDFIQGSEVDGALTVIGGITKSDSFRTTNQDFNLALTNNNIFGLGSFSNVNINLIPQGTGSVITTSQVRASSISFDSGVNSLNFYEEGTWTPTLKFGGGTAMIEYALQLGDYTRIGRTVFYNFTVSLDSKGTDTGIAFFSGLPYDVAATMNYTSICEFSNLTLNASYDIAVLSAQASTDELRMSQIGSAQVLDVIGDNDFADNTQINGSGFYFV